MSRAIEAARAFVRILGDDSDLQRAVARVSKSMATMGAGIAKAGGALTAAAGGALAPLVGAVFSFADAGGKLDDMANVTGISAERLGALGYAAKLSGAELDTVAKASLVMAKQIKAAGEGSAGATGLLSELGVSLSELQGLSPDEQMLRLADAVAGVADPGRKAALAMEIFGKSGASLLPMFADGSAGVRQLMNEAVRLGGVMSNESVASAAAFGDAWDRVSVVLGGIVNAVGGALAPVLTILADMVSENGAQVVGWVRANGGAIVGVAALAAAVGGLGVALVAVGGTLAAVGAALGFVLSPMGLLLAAAVGLGTWFVKSTDAAAVALGWLSETFGPLATVATETFDALKSAMTGGDWGAAANVLWSGLKVAFLDGTAGLQRVWLDWKKSFLETFFAAMAAVRSKWVATQDWLAAQVAKAIAAVDPKLSADDVLETLREDQQRRDNSAAVEAEREAAERQRKYVADSAAIGAEAAAAKAEWEAAKAAAMAAAGNAGGPGGPPKSGGALEDPRFAELLDGLRGPGGAVAVAQTAAAGPRAQDVRSVGGAGILTALFNRTGSVQERQLIEQQASGRMLSRLVKLAEQGPKLATI